jgi:integrase
MLGLLGLRIFEATGADVADLGEEHGHRVLRVCGKGTKIVLILLPPAVGRAIDRAIGARTSGPILLNSRGARMDRHAATAAYARSSKPLGCGSPGPPPHAPPCLRHHHARCGRGPPATSKSRPATPILDCHPNYILAAHMASGT